ncbi:MAG: hypothetical protein Q4D61_05935 [Cardiobacteriaceae bacterium]|nr:hypothetical protein [Cardiobacteriaceae bacterium]
MTFFVVFLALAIILWNVLAKKGGQGGDSGSSFFYGSSDGDSSGCSSDSGGDGGGDGGGD